MAWVYYTQYDNELIIRNIGNIKDAVAEYRLFFSGEKRKDDLIDYEWSTLYEAVFPMIVNLMIQDFVEPAEAIFSAFFELPEPSMATRNVLHMVPDGSFGNMLFSSRWGLVNREWDNPNLYGEVVSLRTKFLQLDHDNPDIRGRASEETAQAYAAVLNKFFIVDKWPANLLETPGYFLHEEGNHPLQAIIVEKTERCLPSSRVFDFLLNKEKLRKS